MTWRPAEIEERQLALLWGVAAAGALALRPLWLALAPHMRPCPFRTLTGIPCPTCGTTRAGLAFLDGHLLQALAANPLALIAGFVFILGGLLAPLWALARLPMPVLPRPPAWALRITAAIALAGTWAWVIATS